MDLLTSVGLHAIPGTVVDLEIVTEVFEDMEFRHYLRRRIDGRAALEGARKHGIAALFTEPFVRRVVLSAEIATGQAGGAVSLTSTSRRCRIAGIDWRAPERRWGPAVAGNL